jgi:hypothetical protein
MSVCYSCNQEMKQADSCVGQLDTSVIVADERCPDCNVAPGGTHHGGCDVERCSTCGGQWISCGHEDHEPEEARWTGEWPGVAECRALNLYCRTLHADGTPATAENPITSEDIQRGGIRWHVPCKKDDVGAHADLNRLPYAKK